MSLSLPKPPPKYDASDQAQLRAIIERADAQNYKKTPNFLPVGANPTATAKETAVNGSATTFMRSDGAPAVQKGSSSLFGIVKADGTSITASGGVISAALPVGANPTATAKDTAVNGSATTFMRSDGAPAVQKGSSSLFGIVKADGTSITASGGVISAVNEIGAKTSFTPVDNSGAGLTFSSVSAAYILLGPNAVFLDVNVTYPVTASTAVAKISMPFTASQIVPFPTLTSSASIVMLASVLSGAAEVRLFNTAGAASIRNSDLSGVIVRYAGIILI